MTHAAFARSVALCRVEMRRTWRDRVIGVMLVTIAVGLAAAVVVSHRVTTATAAVTTAMAETAAKTRATLRQQIVARDTGSVGVEPVLAYSLEESVILPARPLALLSNGARDVEPSVARLTLYADPLALFDEPEGTRNPAALAIGRLDIAFVLVWLLPLAVLSCTYGVLSVDRDSGNLPLALSQPITRRHLAGIRTLVVAVAIVGMTIGCVSIATLVATRNPQAVLAAWPILSWSVAAYVGFWAGLAYLVNAVRWTASTNAIVLGALWLLIVPLGPALIAAGLGAFGPAPDSPALMAQGQQHYANAVATAPAMLDEYYARHPEYDRTVASGIDAPMRAYWLALDATARQTAPFVEETERRRSDQARLIDILQFTLPPVAFQQTLDRLAGTSDARFVRFTRQAREYFAERQRILVPWLFQSHALTVTDFDGLPSFQFQEETQSAQWKALAAGSTAITVMTAMVWMAGWICAGRSTI